MIAVVDYGMGNLRSVLNACEAVGAAAVVAAEPGALREADGIILPGVGAFADGMAGLRARGLDSALAEEVRGRGKPLLGICLGMQLLADRGSEHGDHPGLGWLAGRVDRLPAGPGLRLPHIGWNSVRFVRRDGAFAGLGEAADFYFVHAYALAPRDETVVSGVCEYGADFTAAVEAGNVWAVQFHPEKSQKAGLTVLRNWLARVATW